MVCALHMYRNWLGGVSKDGVHIWDVRTGAELAVIHSENRFHFRINGEVLLTRSIVDGSFIFSDYEYRLYDFTRAVTKLNLRNPLEESHSPSHCLVM